MGKNKILELTFGVLFNHSFKLNDRWGSIADTVLYGNEYFSADYFPRFELGRLFNLELGHILKLSSDNLVYTHVLQSDDQGEKDMFEKRVTKFLVPKVIEDNTLVTRRLGVVYKCEITEAGKKAFVDKVFVPEFKSISDFRFSKKESTLKGSNFTGTDSYINKIYTVGSVEKASYITFDFQLHFVPPLAYVNNEIASFFSSSKTHLSNEILSLGE